ncbi:MAG TPA: basic secretory protein-like protein [Verrucomicrobiota bacterium]|nr:basic secretory protein-like protein [Verrucomicrobiota bacterium]HRT09729.1 basic secretory protein-like protein [Candidatus Paceibacterota bacterium]
MAVLASSGFAADEAVVVVVVNHRGEDAAPGFRFEQVPGPRRQDAAAKATFTLVDGRADANGAGLEALHDGLLPTEEDQPSANFFFRAGSRGGRIGVDLGAAIEVGAVNTYSWHPGGRGPQVYTLYGSVGTNAGFVAAPARPADPSTNGWVRLARVDTRPAAAMMGGQYGVSIAGRGGALGVFRHLLFDIEPTDAADPFGHTFYSEIDVVAPNAPPEPAAEAVAGEAGPHRRTIRPEGGYEIVLDTSEAPDLTEWAERKLVPMIEEWYPKLVAMLPSEGYTAPQRVTINIRKDMQGVAATSGTRINCAANWMRRELNREAVGSVLHELVHVVQQYGRARRTQPSATRPPGWLVEGIPDYIRWFLYEPESRGAEIPARNLERARYDASYRVSANFLNWVVNHYDKDLVRKLNAAIREGKYSESLWKDYTGHTVEELGEKWKAELVAKAGGS